MKVLMFHNRYRQLGGEDLSTEQETEALRSRGVEVIRADFDNESSAGGATSSHLAPSTRTSIDTLRKGWRSAWSRRSCEQARDLCRLHRPDVAHVQNFWMRLTPSVHAGCHAAGVPTVQALRNYRLLCANALLLRNGRPCEDCVGKVPWRGVVRSCYRDSCLASAAVTRMIVENRWRKTWETQVDAFLTLSEHARSRFLRAGFPEDRVFVKPNCVPTPPKASGPPSASNQILYLGRLSKEKGVDVLLRAWKDAGLGHHGRLMIAGDGDERTALEATATSLGFRPGEVVFHGRRPASEIPSLIQAARAVVLPSLAYETFGRPVVEAFAVGRPAVVSDLGAPAETVEHGWTGLHFTSADAGSLGAALKRILTDPGLADQLGERAHRRCLSDYTPQRNFDALMRTYRFTIERRRRPLPEQLQAFRSAQSTA